jgi:hypothetical protein
MKPDHATAATLSAVIENDIRAIESMTRRLGEIADSMNPESFTELAGAAYLLHNIYNALENTFEQISRSFENHVKDVSKWHKELLGKMFLDIPGIRPAVFPQELRSILNELRGFRHIFRHSYDFEIDPRKLQIVIEDFSAKQEKLVMALSAFKRWLLCEAEE